MLVDDHILGKDSVFYDRENPPMKVGTIYASMNEFRVAVRQHAIKEQFQLAIENLVKICSEGTTKLRVVHDLL